MKKFLSLIAASALGVIQPSIASAQMWNMPQAQDSFAYASIFAGNFSLLLSILIGIIAVVIVFRAAKKLGGGLFGSVLNYIGVGILLIVLGTLATVIDPLFSGFWLNLVSTVCFSVGYIFTVLGANKLFKGIMNT
jgi:hypothetical protein